MSSITIPFLKHHFTPLVELIQSPDKQPLRWTIPSGHKVSACNLQEIMAGITSQLLLSPVPIQEIYVADDILRDMFPDEVPCWLTIKQALLMFAALPMKKAIDYSPEQLNPKAPKDKLVVSYAPSSSSEMKPIPVRKIKEMFLAVPSSGGDIPELVSKDSYKLLSVFTSYGEATITADNRWLLYITVNEKNQQMLAKIFLTVCSGAWSFIGTSLLMLKDTSGLTIEWYGHSNIQLVYYGDIFDDFHIPSAK